MPAELRIFPTSREEFKTATDLRSWLHVGLRLSGGNYHLHTGISKIECGSIGLFRFDQDIVGEAVVAKDGAEPCDHTEGGIRYESVVCFDPRSIRIYQRSVPIERVAEICGRDLSVARTYHKIEDWKVYPKLLAEIVSNSGFC